MPSLDFSELEKMLALADEILHKPYLNTFAKCATLPASIPFNRDTFKLIKIKTAICCNNNLLPFAYALSALHSLGITISYIIDVSPAGLTTYIGVQHTDHTCTAMDLLIKSLYNIYTSFEYELIENTDFLHQALFSTLTAVTMMPNLTGPLSCSSALLKPFIQLTKNACYTLVLLANPLNLDCVMCERDELEDLYTAIFPFHEVSHTNHHHQTESRTDTCSCNHAHNLTDTCNKSNSTSCSSTLSTTISDGSNTTLKPKDILTIGKNANTSNTDSRTENCTENLSDSSSKQLNDSKTTTYTDTCTDLDIHTFNFKTHNLKVANLLTQIPKRLKRYEEILYRPMFNLNAYFLSPNTSDCLLAATSYRGLLEDRTPPLYPSAINTWSSHNTSFIPLLDTLTNLESPLFFLDQLPSPRPLGVAITTEELNKLLSPLISSSGLSH